MGPTTFEVPGGEHLGYERISDADASAVKVYLAMKYGVDLKDVKIIPWDTMDADMKLWEGLFNGHPSTD